MQFVRGQEMKATKLIDKMIQINPPPAFRALAFRAAGMPWSPMKAMRVMKRLGIAGEWTAVWKIS